jgi:hypothetical protein
MKDRSRFLHRHATRIAAVAVLLALYGFARLPRLPDGERASLASRFAFAKSSLPELAPSSTVAWHTTREVNPSLANHSAWIAAVGAGVALADIDGDGLPNDLCHVDTRVDRALVSPVPGTGGRYPLFSLEAAPLPYDRRTMAPMGCLPGDFNEDGRNDLLVYYWGRTPVLFLRRGATDGQAPRAELYRPVELLAGGERWFTNALTSADVDGDGHLDLIVGNYFQDGARILDARATVPDAMQASMSRADNAGSKRLFLFTGANGGPEPTAAFRDVPGVFDEQTAHSWTLAVGAADLDGDLLPELYFANDFGPDRMLYNRSTPGRPSFLPVIGSKTFFTPNSKVLGHDSFKGMGVDFADLNGDGVLDLYVSNIAQEWSLQESHFVWMSQEDPAGTRDALRRGEAPYHDGSESLGLSRSYWGWDARFVDFDNDSVPEAVQACGFLKGETNRWPELHELAMGNDNMLHRPFMWPHFTPGADLSGSNVHNPFFVRAASGRYYDLAADLGMDQPQVTRGIAVADVDGDGRLDYAVANQWEASYFYRNQSPSRGAWLDLDLRLPAAGGRSRPAIGAEAAVRLPDGRRLIAAVDGGSGHSGKRVPRVHFGLGRLPSNAPLAVEVRYRDERGAVHGTSLSLPPGRHTVVLGATPPAGKVG